MKKVLAELKDEYTFYAPLWRDWVNSRQCGLTSGSIYLLNHCIQTKFQPGLQTNSPSIKVLISDLKKHREDFKKWTMQKLTAALLYKGIYYKVFFAMPIQSLEISPQLKQGLLKLNTSSVVDILSKLDDKQYCEKHLEDLISCAAVLLKEEKRNAKKKKEAAIKT